MNDAIKIRNLKVTKVQETETETDSGITNKWTYTLQDEDKENSITLKVSEEKTIVLGGMLDVTIGNDQTTLDFHVKDEAEALADIIDEQGLMDKVVKKIEKHPELAEIVKDRLAKYNKLKDKKEALGKILEKAKSAEEPEEDDCGCTEDEPCDEHKHMEHHRPEEYGVCVNCGKTIELTEQHECQKTEPCGDIHPDYEEITYTKLKGHDNVCYAPGRKEGQSLNWTRKEILDKWKKEEAIKADEEKKGSPNTPSKKKPTPENKPAKKWREPSKTSPRGQALRRLRDRANDQKLRPTEEEIQEEKNNPKPVRKPEEPVALSGRKMTGGVLIKKEDFPTKLCGGLMEHVQVQKMENGEKLLYAHARSKTQPSEQEAKYFNTKLKELTGYDWKYTHGSIFNCDSNQLNKIKEG